MPISAALAASIASAALTTAGNVALSERQRKMNEQYQDNMNQYNLPVNQVQRLLDAGISPNALSMGSNGMSVAGNQSAGINPYSTPSLADPMSIISNSFLTMSQGKTEDEMRDIRKAQAVADIENLRANAEKLGVDTQYQSILNCFAAAKEMAAIQNLKSATRLNHFEVAKVKNEAKILSYQLSNILPEELKKLCNENNLLAGQLDLLVAQIANLSADTSLKESQTELNEAQVGLTEAQVGLTESQNLGQTQENLRYDEVTDAVLQQYQATVNKIAAETGLTQQESFYYLYELCRKYDIKLLGTPVFGAGGTRSIDLQKTLQKDAIDKYGGSSIVLGN